MRLIRKLFCLGLLLLGATSLVAQQQKGLLGVGVGRDARGNPSIVRVAPAGPGERAGARVGDVLVSIDGKPIESFQSADELLNALQGPIGSTCRLAVVRDGRPTELSITRASLDAPRNGVPQNPLGGGNANPPTGGAGANPLAGGGNPLAGAGPAPQPVQPAVQLPPGVKLDVDPTHLLPIVAPDVLRAPPPPALRPGLQLVYYLGTVTFPGSSQQLVPSNTPGQYINKQTGQHFKVTDVPTQAGAGWLVIDIGYVDQTMVACTIRNYMLDPHTRKTGMPIKSEGGIFPAGLGQQWASPAALANLPEQNRDGLLIRRMPYTVAGREVRAIRVQSEVGGKLDYTYDQDTGILVHYGSVDSGAQVWTPDPSGVAQPGAGRTTIVSMMLLEVRQVDVPWMNDPAPDWIGRFRRLTYDGVTFTGLPNSGFPDVEKPLRTTVENTGATARWVRTQSFTQTGDPLNDNKFQMVSCGGMCPYAYIPPAGLNRLRPGQELFRDGLLGYTMSVGAADAATVTISEVGGSYRNDATYDRQSGMLVAASRTVNNGAGTQGWRLRLSGQE